MSVRLRVRRHGETGPAVVLVHGGPGAPGYLAPVGRELAARGFRAVEPLQRRAGGAPLTVARHVADLDRVVGELAADGPPAVVGHSWGAMLALAWAAAHPGRAASLTLVACGTFDAASRAALLAEIDGRKDAATRRRLERLHADAVDPDDRLRLTGELLLPLYSCDPTSTILEGLERCDARGHRESWEDMLRLQQQGTYPQRFVRIGAPVLMLHGMQDPHPGRLIRASLAPHLADLHYLEWEGCGHYPWLERQAREKFYTALCGWLTACAPGGGAAGGRG